MVEVDWSDRFAAALRTGMPIKVSEWDPKLDVGWSERERIPADQLRAFVLRKDLDPDPKGLAIHGASVIEDLDLAYANVRFPVRLIGCRLTTVFLQNASLTELDLSSTVASRIIARNTHIESRLTLTEVTLRGDARRTTLDIQCARIADALIASKLTVAGEVLGQSAKINRVDLTEATLANPGGDALVFDGADIPGGLFAVKLVATGEVRAPGANIGHFQLDEAILSNGGGNSLSLDSADIASGLLANKLNSTGIVRAINARIGQVQLTEATLQLTEATLSTPDETAPALALDGAEIPGGMAAEKMKATGEVRAAGAKIWQLDLTDATLTNPGMDALNLQESSIHRLLLDVNENTSGTFDLSRTTTSTLAISALPRVHQLLASGWSIGDLHGNIRTNRKLATEWLCTAPEFVGQPWQEIAAVYDRNGQPSDARRIRITAARLTAEHSPLPTKLLRYGYGILVGFGYRPLLAFAWMAMLASVAFVLSVDRSAFSPTQIAYAKSASTDQECRIKPITAASPRECLSINYPQYNPALYAVTNVTPAGSLQNPAWAPTGAWRSIGLGVIKLGGWLLTAVLLAGLTGLLKKT